MNLNNCVGFYETVSIAAPPPSYQEAIRSTYDNAAFELEPASVDYDAHRDNLNSTPPPRYSR